MKIKVMVLFLAVMSLGLPLWAAVPTSSTGTQIQAPEQPAQPAEVKEPSGSKAITWATIDSINPAASRLTAAACNGKVYRFSGNTSLTSTTVLQEFDPAVGTWATKNPMPFGLYNAPSATWRDRIVLFSGQQYIGGATYLMDSLVIYYPEGDSFQSFDGGPYRAGFSAIAVIADTLYAFGGTADYANGLNTVYACDLTSLTWTAKAVMPVALYGASAVAYDGKVYIFGGRNASVDQNGVMMYSPTADTAGGAAWTTKTSMATSRGGHGAVQIGQYIYVLGGGWGTYLNTVERYDPIADSVGGTPWSADTSFVFGRRTIGAAALGNNAYVVGGWNGAFCAYAERGLTDAPVYNDAAMYRIEIPQYLGNYGVSLTPYVTVSNLSPVTQYNIPVTMTVDSAGTQVYKGTGFVNLDAAATDYAVLPQWSAGTAPGTVYTFKAWVNWPLDQNGANDTMTVTSEVKDAVWFQDDAASATGHAAQNFEPVNDIYDCWLMEDFWIAGPDSLWLDSIYVRGLYASHPGPLDSILFIIMPDSAGAPGFPAFSQPLWSGYFTPANYTEASGSFMVRLPAQVKVYGNNAGLWIAFQGQMNYDVGGQWYMTGTTYRMRGSYEGFFYNPGDGFGVGTGYVYDSAVWPGTTDHAFVLYGGLTPTGVAGQPVDRPMAHKFALAPAWPNPARGSARLNFSLDKASQVALSVYNLAGQKVATVASGSYPAGKHQVVWQGRDAMGNSVPGGVYLYRLQAGDRTATGKLVWLK